MANALSLLAQFVTQKTIAMAAQERQQIRMALIDTLGCQIAGGQTEVVQKTVGVLQSFGLGDCPVIGLPQRFPAPQAALLNAVCGHALDFDDWEMPANSHPSVVIFPALMAASQGRNITGQQWLEAYWVGFEVIARLGEGLNFEHYDAGWHTTATLAPMGAAAAVARLLGLSALQTINALSLAVSQSSGLTCQFGSHAKPLQAGFAAQAGFMAATLAANGCTGQGHALEAKRGYNALTAHGDNYRLMAAIEKCGKPHALTEYGVVPKPYPCCSYTHRIVDAAMQLRPHVVNNLNDIVSIRASLPDFHAAILPFSHPTARNEALFSVPFCCAVALSRGALALRDFEARPLVNEGVARLIDKTQLLPRVPKNPLLNFDPEDPDWLEITMQNGQVHRCEVTYPPGALQNPMSEAQMLEKFTANTGCAVSPDLLHWPEANNLMAILERNHEYSP